MTVITHIFRFALTAVLLAGTVALADDDLATALQNPLQESDGRLSPTLRNAYLDWSEKTVLAQLTADKVEVPASLLRDIHADATLRDAMFGAICPPDPEILRHYIILQKALPPEIMRKYQQLVIAFAVSNRYKEKNIDETNEPSPVEDAGDEDAGNPEKAELVNAVADFMKSGNVAALEIYRKPDVRQKLADDLTNKKIEVPFTPADDPSKELVNVLKQAMIQLGQRPAQRSPKPDEVTWLKYLVKIYESTPNADRDHKGHEMRWPLFPVDQAPWPLLMPLGESLPLDEANFIWEKFNGLHGPNIFHTYGPYKRPAGVIPFELQPSPWHWNAWPDLIVHGGVCTTMSKIAVDTQTCLCIPSVHAGQPGHANLISFRGSDGKWHAEIEQAFAGGPAVTHAIWPFREGAGVAPRLAKSSVAGSEYHLGLALAMNVGLRQYIDTRIACNLYAALPEPDKSAIGVKLLQQAVQTNPFNPQPYYLLAVKTHQAMPIDRNAGSDEDESKPVESATRKFWRTLDEYETELAQSK